MANNYQHRFKASNEDVYLAIEQMIIANAKQYDNKLKNIKKVHDVNYTYGKNNQIHVQVIEADHNQLIKYKTAMQSAETFIVTFELKQEKELTILNYLIEIETTSTRQAANYKLMSFLYGLKQKKAFKKMCCHLEQEIIKLSQK